MKRMACLCALSLALLGLAACGAPTISIPVGEGALAYADVKGLYAEAKAYLTVACRLNKLDAETCSRFAQLDKQMGVVDTMIRRTIRDAKAPVDWDQAMQIMTQVMGMAVKAGIGL